MKTLHAKMLWAIGAPIALFIGVLLTVNFFYVKAQLEEAIQYYVHSIVREVDDRLTDHIQHIEKFAELIRSSIQQGDLINQPNIDQLSSRLIESGGQYALHIAHQSLLVDGILSAEGSQLQITHANEDLNQKHRAGGIKQQINGWTKLADKPDVGWELSYTLTFEADDTNGVVMVSVPLKTLIHSVIDIVKEEYIKLLFVIKRDGDDVALLLDDPVSGQVEQLMLDNPYFSSWLDTQEDLSASQILAGTPSQLTHLVTPSDSKKHLASYFPSTLDNNFYLVALLSEDQVFVPIYGAKLVEAAIALLALLGLVVLIFLLSRTISEPISAFVNKVGQLATGNLHVRFPKTNSCMELNYLSNSLNQTVQRLNRYFSELKKVTAQHEKINSELNIARDIQSTLLPRQRDKGLATNLDLHACTLPAKEVGGDFYYFFKIDKTHIGLVIGDVSGKGMPAALTMAVCLSFFRAEGASTVEPHRFLEKFNQFLMQEDISRAIFVTVFYAVVDIRNGELTYANAGHAVPVIISRDGALESLDSTHGPALAIVASASYTSCKSKLSRGDRLLFYTDGVTEAHNFHQEEFGEQRLLDVLQKMVKTSKTLSAKGCVQGVVAELSHFTHGCVQFDDITLMCVILGARKDEPLKALSSERSETSYEMTIKSKSNEINQALKMLTTFCQEHRVGENITADLCVVLDEFLSNIIRHAQLATTQDIGMQFSKQADTVIIRLEYQGTAFNPLQMATPNIEEHWQKQKAGGLGIYIGQQLSDHITYSQADDKNILIFEKKITT